MELIVSYLIYVLGAIAVVSIIALARVKVHTLNLRAEMFKMVVDKKIPSKMDINNLIK